MLGKIPRHWIHENNVKEAFPMFFYKFNIREPFPTLFHKSNVGESSSTLFLWIQHQETFPNVVFMNPTSRNLPQCYFYKSNIRKSSPTLFSRIQHQKNFPNVIFMNLTLENILNISQSLSSWIQCQKIFLNVFQCCIHEFSIERRF